MKSLAITDLSCARDLDQKSMSAVRGGMDMDKRWYPPLYGYDGSKHDFSLDVSQLNSQSQQVNNENGVNVAFADNIRSTIKPTQTASNSVSF